MIEFRLPDVGEGIAEGTIVKWLVKVGDNVKADQTIVQVETDKSVADLPSPVGGVILEIPVPVGHVIKVGAVLCVIGQRGESVTKMSAPTPSTNIKQPVVQKLVPPITTVKAPVSDTITKELVTPTVQLNNSVNNMVLAVPAARKMAQEKGIDLATIKGTGPNGVILVSDVTTVRTATPATVVSTPFAEKTVEPASNVKTIVSLPIGTGTDYSIYGSVRKMPITGIRRTIAERMTLSQQITAPVTCMEDVDVSAIEMIRKREKEHFELEGIKLTYLPFVVKAVTQSLIDFPMFNSVMEQNEIIIKEYYNLGIAVQTDAGLMVPVIKDTNRKSIASICQTIQELAAKARARALTVSELKGGTFTITNYGSVGGTYGTPIINPGESGILGLGRVFDRLVLDEKTGKIRNTKIMPLSLTFDHRLIDGAMATEFLVLIKRILEHPEEIFLEKRDSKVKSNN